MIGEQFMEFLIQVYHLPPLLNSSNAISFLIRYPSFQGMQMDSYFVKWRCAFLMTRYNPRFIPLYLSTFTDVILYVGSKKRIFQLPLDSEFCVQQLLFVCRNTVWLLNLFTAAGATVWTICRFFKTRVIKPAYKL